MEAISKMGILPGSFVEMVLQSRSGNNHRDVLFPLPGSLVEQCSEVAARQLQDLGSSRATNRSGKGECHGLLV